VLGAFSVAALIGLPISAANGTGVADDVPFVLVFAVFGVVGALIVSRDPGNRVGILFLWVCVVAAAGFLSAEVATLLYDAGRRGGFAVTIASVVGEGTWILGILPTLALLPLLFPAGHLPSPRWRPVLWATWAAVGFVFAAFMLGSPTMGASADRVRIPNPVFVPALAPVAEGVEAVFFWAFLVILGAAVTSLVLRFRRSSGLERQQIAWFAFAVLFFLAATITSEVLFAFGIESVLIDVVLVAPAFLSLPVSVGIAVLRYRLWDLDVVVKKALIAGTLVLLAILVYAATVVLIPTVVEFENPVALFVVALALGIAFRPAMRVARRFADRLVYGRRATPYEVLTEFSERLGSSYGTEDVLPRIAQVLGEGTGAEVARVWLASGRELRQAAAWPEGADPRPPLPLAEGAAPAPAGESAVEVRDRGELLGALSVRMPASDPMNPAKEKLVSDLAAQAGLVLRNVRLVDDLRASRQRLVAAQDAERRRLERNIHDGAQQQLVAIAVKARLARQLLQRDPERAADAIGQIEAETQTALEDLRDLARGIYPPLLADEGLVAAIGAQARKAPLPVEVESDAVGRYPAEIEATVYFCALEALQNVSKYAAARRAVVRLAQVNGTLAFEVVDDGRGFDPGAVRSGTGLQGMADRLAAVGGSLDVRSSEGAGTTVIGLVPVTVA
jgi:signal transduction histidine kinase